MKAGQAPKRQVQPGSAASETSATALEVPFLFKQWGEWMPEREFAGQRFKKPTLHMAGDGTHMLRVGKAAAGRLLDGRTWDGVPWLLSRGRARAA